MGYDKETIDCLFCQYVGTGDNADLEALIVSCKPLIETVVSRYDELSSCRDDLVQETLLRLWLALCNRERATQETEHPHNWIYKLVRDAVVTVVRQYSRQLALPLRLTSREREIVDMHDGAQRSFESIAQELKVCVETVKCYYSVAHSKLDSAAKVGNDKTLLEKADQSNLDPAKRYEMKDLHRTWREKLHRLSEQHPNISVNEASRKAFMCYIDDLIGRELTDL